MSKQNELWQTDDSDSDPGQGPSTAVIAPKRKTNRAKEKIGVKRRKTQFTDKPEVTGSNMRSIYSALTRDKNIMHDFGKILQAKITGNDVHISELRTAAQVGTRSTVDDVIIKDRIETRSRQKKTKLANLGNITTFSKAELPSDDSDDDEFNISASTAGSEILPVSPEHSDSSDVSDVPVSDTVVDPEEEESRISIRSEESVQVIAKKTRSKVKITDPIENIVGSFRPPDYDEFEESLLSSNLYGTDEPGHEHYSKFLNDTFVNDISHADDDDDEDFNPNEFIDDLLDLNKEKLRILQI